MAEFSFRKIYWVLGEMPKNMRSDGQYMVKNPPTSGWSSAFMFIGEKKTTIFCPYSYEAFDVPSSAREVTGSEERPITVEKAEEILNRNWELYQRLGHSRAYDVAVRVYKVLGLEAPAQLLSNGEEDTQVRGGKEVGSALKKPVNQSSKRGKFLAWFLEGEGSRSIREAMAEFDMSRSNVLSYLYMLRKDHGIGYTLAGDVAKIELPADCENPFE